MSASIARHTSCSVRAVFVPWLALMTCVPANAAATVADFEIVERSIVELRQAMQDGNTTSRAITEAYIARISAMDAAGPRLNSVIELNPDALRDAERLDAERARGEVRGPLHGVPLLLKDNIDARPMVTSAGSLALATHRPDRDAFVVVRLRAAGAVILGKTNLSEWANFRSTRSTSGWSGRGGQTRNPYALDRNPCGSSSGSGVAAAASLAAATVGTETDGSIICPSAVNGVVGIKPTVGLISRRGIVPISPSQDTAGPMARSVSDAAILLAAMVGHDPSDAAMDSRGEVPTVDYAAHLKAESLRGARLGVMRKTLGFHPDVDAAFERALTSLRAAGAEIIDPSDLATHGTWNDAEFQVLLYEFRPALEAYLQESDAPLKSLEALMAFNEANASTSMPWFGQELFTQASTMGPLSESAYRRARDRARRLAGRDGIEAELKARQLDALIAPAVAPAWVTDVVNGDHFLGAGYGAAAVAGTPSLTVPMGESHGLPLGIVFMGSAYSEGRLIELAYAFEQATRLRKPPDFRKSISESEITH